MAWDYLLKRGKGTERWAERLTPEEKKTAESEGVWSLSHEEHGESVSAEMAEAVWFFYIDTLWVWMQFCPIKAKQNKIKQQQNRKKKWLGYDEHHSLSWHIQENQILKFGH